MEKFLQVFRRFINVLWFLITVPILLYIIFAEISDEFKGKYGYFHSYDAKSEIAYIYKYDYLDDQCYYSKYNRDDKKCDIIQNLSDEEMFDRIKNEDLTKRFLNGEITSYKALRELGQYVSDYKFHHTGKSIFYSVLYGVLLIFGYIILVDLLIKTGGYIWNGKFGGGINYKKLFKLK